MHKQEIPRLIGDSNSVPLTQVKTEETDGYSAVQVGYRTVPERKITRPQAGHLKKAGVEPMRKLREFRVRKPHINMALAASWQACLGQDSALEQTVTNAMHILCLPVCKGAHLSPLHYASK